MVVLATRKPVAMMDGYGSGLWFLRFVEEEAEQGMAHKEGERERA